VRAGFLRSNDLAVQLLREQLTEAPGIHPLSGQGVSRWGREMLVIYGGGLLASPPSSDP
jgi:TetR/AcrR family transcriptional regulator, regulator of cefoperazone and chloramphenicol sensitivity